jgi:flagellar basal body P-ring protein FlgI
MRTRTLFLTLLFTLPALSAAGAPVRIKDLVDVQGVRDNALFG